ncbi:uncharacterized protein K452DRAFT_352498 [Aplosporella prunicola CBS 121167]|uniref:LYC1 C-terminal domain-containing protein n=1 Tax=Aplosporella prunicola CBS 121167 TaxID=1176127 RepID=A0A6A6B6J8_9PEZI|nr:uncharacterized protein K452DRAFT_352498 [Aplosporella prunicola CBS 121167]KAF2139762.1 hypothetical protein K452DRAFT_352498 [Aplosporella prunicola CBS 121167]
MAIDTPVRQDGLPDSTSPNLHLSHPTREERHKIWTSNSVYWKDSLSVPVYLRESEYLTTVALAKDNGLTFWILVDKNLAPNQRPILSSCETLRKRSLTSDAEDNVEDTIVHSISGVFCFPEYRRRGYAARLMREMATALHGWQTGTLRCVGSILYSDIGKTYYASLGWGPNRSNTHVVFAPTEEDAQPVRDAGQPAWDLVELCGRDEALIRKAMAAPADAQERVTVIPDLDHMLWHIAREAFTTRLIFGQVPRRKGAIAGAPGRQVWAIWTHRYCGYPAAKASNNVLHILRLVIENETASKTLTAAEKEQHAAIREEQAGYLEAVLQSARAEASQWRLDRVEMWVRDMVVQTGLEHCFVEREKENIASGLWYDENGGAGPAPEWLNNEYYSWC